MYHSGLLTDLYQITMAYGFWKNNLHNQNAIFHLFFRNNPFKGGYTIACGLEQAVDFMLNFHFSDEEVDYLSTLKGSDDTHIFDEGFLTYLKEMKFTCDVAAIPEGTIVFPHEPLLRVTGPIVQCQLIESALLNIVNFQSLIATKSARINEAAMGDPVMEFGLRRAQGADGSLSATRAAFVGGAMGTSNVLAARKWNMPALGTHAHSWVQAFDDEASAFTTFAEAMPQNTTLLVDTYDTIEGINLAVKVAKQMLAKGHKIFGIRLDSGDLAYLSQYARQKFNAEGVGFMKIVASNDLDEHIITSLKLQEAAIDVWGVGTKLVTAFDQPALGGVYKLSAVQASDGKWLDKIKLSENSFKINIPGTLQVKRFYKDGQMLFDMIYDERDKLSNEITIIDPADSLRRKRVNLQKSVSADLLKPIIKNGIFTGKHEDLKDIQKRREEELQQLDKTHRRLTNPHIYHVGIEQQLYDKRMDLILKNKNRKL